MQPTLLLAPWADENRLLNIVQLLAPVIALVLQDQLACRIDLESHTNLALLIRACINLNDSLCRTTLRSQRKKLTAPKSQQVRP